MSKGLTNEEVRGLYVRYGHLVLRRCRATLRDSALAEDALQEIFLRTLKYGASVRSASSDLAWLYRVTDNYCYTLLGARHRRCSDARALAEHSLSRPEPSIEQGSDELHGLLSSLARIERDAVMLLYVDGMSQAEVSKQLGRSRQTINKYVKNIRRLALKVLTETA